MLFTWDTNNLCIVFRQWHIRSTASLVFSLAAVVLLAVGYEGLRALSRRYELAVARHVGSLPSMSSPSPLPPPNTPLLQLFFICLRLCDAAHMLRLPFPLSRGDDAVAETTPFFFTPGQNQAQAGRRAHLIKGVLYALQNFYAFMLM